MKPSEIKHIHFLRNTHSTAHFGRLSTWLRFHAPKIFKKPQEGSSKKCPARSTKKQSLARSTRTHQVHSRTTRVCQPQHLHGREN